MFYQMLIKSADLLPVSPPQYSVEELLREAEHQVRVKLIDENNNEFNGTINAIDHGVGYSTIGVHMTLLDGVQVTIVVRSK